MLLQRTVCKKGKTNKSSSEHYDSSSPHTFTKPRVSCSLSCSEFQGLSIVKANGQYIHPLANGEMSLPYEQFLIYLKPNQKVSFVEENSNKFFMIDNLLLNIIQSNVYQ